MTTLHTTNPLHLTWQYEAIDITILGGIKLEGLDRLRVTLKIDNGSDTIRHNIDLYNDRQAEQLIRKAAERFGIGTAYITKMLGELTNQLEAYRITEIDKQQQQPERTKTLSEQQRAEATAFLQQPHLLQRINQHIGQSGLIGEEQNRLLMYIIYTSRKREYPLHIISLAASGTGKSYLQESVAALIPDEDKIEITVLSENAFYYFGQRELKHKLLLIEDLDGAQNVLYPLRELQSKKRISKTIAHKDKSGNTQTTNLVVEGPVSVAGCTTKEHIYEDNANRSFLIYLDDSPEQDERIMARQRAVSAGQINHQAERRIKELLQNTQRILEPISVRNPYAPQLQIPNEVFKPRRSNAHYLQFIEAITFLKQYQRTHKADTDTGEIYIETTLEDIQEANHLMNAILLRKSDELNGATRNHLEQIKNYLRTQNRPPDSGFSTKEIRQAYKLNPSNQKRYMLHLLQTGYLKKAKTKTKSYAYQVTNPNEYRQLQDHITHILDGILHQAQEVQSSKRVQTPNEPIITNTVAGNSHKVQKSAKKGVPINNDHATTGTTQP